MALMILYAVALHLVQAVSLLFDPVVVGVTSIFAVQQLLGDRLMTSLLLALVALLAVLGLAIRSVALMLPQQFFLVVGAAGAVRAMWMGQYADGVPRPPWFLFADQTPVVLCAIGHTLAVILILRTRESGDESPWQKR